MANDRPEPIDKRLRFAESAAQATEIEMGMRVHETRKNSAIAEVDVRLPAATRLHGQDTLAAHNHDAAFERGLVNGYYPTRRQGPKRGFVRMHAVVVHFQSLKRQRRSFAMLFANASGSDTVFYLVHRTMGGNARTQEAVPIQCGGGSW
jgi:hypothetical protein